MNGTKFGEQSEFFLFPSSNLTYYLLCKGSTLAYHGDRIETLA